MYRSMSPGFPEDSLTSERAQLADSNMIAPGYSCGYRIAFFLDLFSLPDMAIVIIAHFSRFVQYIPINFFICQHLAFLVIVCYNRNVVYFG